jgi:hypothetical protein
MKFRKKPVVIEAVQFTISPDCVAPLLEFTEGAGAQLLTDSEGYHMRIPTLEGDMRANPGDWIIKGVNGEFYPCKPDIFEKTYEPAE